MVTKVRDIVDKEDVVVHGQGNNSWGNKDASFS